MNNAMTTPFPDGKPLTDQDIPALMGVDPDRSRWTLWQQKTRPEVIPVIDQDLPLEDALRENVLQWGLEHGQLGPGARKPKEPVAHHSLPLTVQPDFVIPSATSYGPGPGIGILCMVPRWRWYQQWQSSSIDAQPPQDAYVRLQTLMMTLSFKDQPLQWGLVVANTESTKLHPPILIEANPDVRDSIADAILAFQKEVQSGEVPSPTAEDLKAITAIHSAHPSPDHEPWEPPEDVQVELRKDIQEYIQLKEKTRSLQAQLAEATRPMAALQARIAARCAPHGQVRLDDKIIQLRAKAERPANPTARNLDINIGDASLM